MSFSKKIFPCSTFNRLWIFFSPSPTLLLPSFSKSAWVKPAPVVVEADKKPLPAGILRQVDKTGIAVFQDIVDQFLDNPENDQFVFCFEAFAVIVKPGAGIHASGTADLLEEVIYRGFQTEILQGWGHQAVGDIPDQLDGIVDDLLGIVDALELGLFVQVYEILVEVEPGRGEQGAGIVVQVGSDALAFFFLQPDGSVQQGLLLVLFHALELLLVADHFALVEADEYNQSDRKGQHTDGAEKQHHRNIVVRT